MGMRTAIVLLMAAGLGLNALGGNAQETSRRALAEELLNAMDMKQTMEKSFAMIKKMIPAQMKRIKATTEENKTPSNAAQQKVMDEAMDTVSKELSWEKMKADYIAIYAETFTAEELRGIIAFYKSPAGQAFKKKQPELMERSMKVTQKRLIQIMPTIQALSKKVERKPLPPLLPPKDERKAEEQ
jgi:hypothetical protein